MVLLIFMLFLFPVQAQGESNSEKFEGVVKEVKQLVKTDLVTSLEKLTVLNDQLSSLSIEQNLIYFKLVAEIYIEQNRYTIAKEYTNQGLKIAKRLASPSILISELLYLKGFATESLGDIVQAGQLYKSGLDVAESLHNRVKIAEGLINLGAIAYLTDDYERSLVLLNDAYNIASQTNDEELKGAVNSELGIVYSYLSQDAQSMAYYQQSYQHFKKAGMLITAHNSLINIAINHIYNENFQQAIVVFQTIITESNKDSPSDIMFNVYSGMAWAYLEKRDSNPEAAYKYLLLAKQYLQSTDKYDVQLKFFIDEAYILYELEQYDEALNSIEQAEAILMTHQGSSLLKKQNYVSIINLKANVYYKQGQFEQAYSIKSAVVTAITAIYDKKESSSITQVRLKLESEQADKQTEFLNNQQHFHQVTLHKAKLANEEHQLYIIISSIITLLLIWLLITLLQSQYKLTVASNRDPLTGINNRYSLIKKIQAVFKQAKNAQADFCLLMIDIDNLKNINHRLGHTVGDEVLKQVATLVASIMRKNDVFGRFGGEEFIVCLPNTSSEFAMDIAERIRLCIQEHTWQLDNVDNVCVSIGLAYLENDIDLIRLISCADEQLYQAKASGRNRVCSI
jgi:diguanylate cyclase (GGDEF)-like protein